ncbi:hypothetical protein HDU85_003174 [Gaertneriomyces sp. JEL0708]|nr:hypothetical protein HDU85_003174 [Gaertneriomyces sp. JEL0708]
MQSIVIQQPPYVQAPQKKEKKKKKKSFFGFGKKKASSSDDDQDVSSVVSTTVSSQTTPYNNAAQAYGPAQQQPQQQQQQQQPNNGYLDVRPHYDFPQQQQKIIRRSIIIAEDEGRFGAPLLDVSEPGHPRRPESFLKEERLRDERLKEEGLRESYVRHARGVSYLGPPRMESLAGVRSAGSGSPERGGPSSRERTDHMSAGGSTTTATQSASIGSPEASFGASAFEPQTGAPSLSAPSEVRIKSPSPIITNGAPNNTNYSTSSTSTTTPLIHIVRPTNLISPVHPSPDNTYLLSEDDFSDFTEEEWSDEYDSDDRDYGNDRATAGGRDRGWDDDDEEDGWMDIDEETLRNTEMNAVIPPHTITPTKYQTQTPREGSASKSGPQRHVGFNRTTQECKGAYVDEEGRLLGYGSPSVWEGTLRGGSEGTDESGESGGEGGSGTGAAPMVFVRKSSLERGVGNGTNGTSRGQESATVGPKGGVMTPSSPVIVPTQQQPPYGTVMAATGLSTNHPNQAQAQTGQGGQSVVQQHPQGPLPTPNVSQTPLPLQQPQQQQPRRKKIRHVQIQTRPSVNAVSTQTDFATLTTFNSKDPQADPHTQTPAMNPAPPIAIAAESVTAMAALSSSSHAAAPVEVSDHINTIQELEEQLAEMHLLVQDHKRRIAALTQQNTDLTQHTAQLEQQNVDLTHRNADFTKHRAELERQNADLTHQNTTLAQQNTTLTQEKTVLDRRLIDQQTRFDRLSKQAYMRIRQLVVERDAREVEVDVLRGVVGGSS